MGSENEEYPALDRRRLRDGYRKCVSNASRLLDDAALLKEAGRSRSAYLILRLAVNELGNAIRLYDAGRSGVRDWEEWWSRYFAERTRGQPFDDGKTGEAVEKSDRLRQELTYVRFDRQNGAFLTARPDGDGELLELFDEEAAYAQSILETLPSTAFERIEFREIVQQSEETALPTLYGRIEEIMSEDPSVGEEDLLHALAEATGMSTDEAAAGFEQWKKVAPKARAYMDLLHRVQGRLKQKQEGKGEV